MNGNDVNEVALAVFGAIFALVTVLGFVAARWRRGDLTQLDEWGLAGRRFGTVISWFLLGGDIYTAYAFVAVPALVYGAGALGFFPVMYTTIVYPLVFLLMPRLWSVCKRHQYVTGADFVQGRFGSRGLGLAVAITGLVATMPYIALQLLGIQVVLQAMGLPSEGVTGELPLVLAFLILAAYTYTSGVRAPAMISVVKDVLIYVTVLVAVIYIPTKLGGFGGIFDAAERGLSDEASFIPKGAAAHTAYATLAVGSALAFLMYPNVLTGVLSAGSRKTIQRNAALLPMYTLLLGLIALLGYVAIADGLVIDDPNMTITAVFGAFFPSWFEGLAFAAIAVGALVPAAMMSIASANLFSRTVYKGYLRPDATASQETLVAKLVSLVVKVGAVACILLLPTKFAVDLQLLGGVWILQTLPAIGIGLYTAWFHRDALIAGWAAGMALGTAMAVSQDFQSLYPLDALGLEVSAYAGLLALAVNLVAATAGTWVLSRLRIPRGVDATDRSDYDRAHPRAEGSPNERILA